MKTSTETLVASLRILSNEIYSEDGVANAAVMEAADRITDLSRIIADFKMELDEDLELMKSSTDKMSHAVITINALREHIQILIVAGNDMAQLLCLGKSKVPGCVARWNNAKEVHT